MGTTKDIRNAVEAELEFGPLVDDAAEVAVAGLTGVRTFKDDIDIGQRRHAGP